MKKRLVSLLALVGLAAGALAQQMPSPPEELSKLSWMLGEWEGSMIWTMPGMEGEMKSAVKCEMDGMFIRCTSKMESEGMSMSETTFMGWNAAENRYDMWTFTNFAPTPRTEYGSLDGDTFITVSQPWAIEGMGEIVGRSTSKKLGDSEYSFKLEFKQGDEFIEVAHGTMKKKA